VITFGFVTCRLGRGARQRNQRNLGMLEVLSKRKVRSTSADRSEADLIQTSAFSLRDHAFIAHKQDRMA
jgi:hypothetical protein